MDDLDAIRSQFERDGVVCLRDAFANHSDMQRAATQTQVFADARVPSRKSQCLPDEECNEYTKDSCPRESGCIVVPSNLDWMRNLIKSEIIETQPIQRVDREIEKSIKNGKLFMDPLLLAIDNKLDQIRNRQEEIFEQEKGVVPDV